MNNRLDILIPTYHRPAALAVTLTSLVAQTEQDFRVVISDQSEECDVAEFGEVKAVQLVLESHGHIVEIHKNLPRRGMAEQRHFLLDQVRAPYALFLDDDLILEPCVLKNLLNTIEAEKCGFVGAAVIGLSFKNDVRPHEQAIEFWEGPVEPEVIQPNKREFERYKLHNAANLYHVQQNLGLNPDNPLRYRVAWVGGCVIYDASKLRSVGGFGFWTELPYTHAGEDVLAQWRIMARFGGCGLIPSGVYHQELPTTVPDRTVDAPKVLGLAPKQEESVSECLGETYD